MTPLDLSDFSLYHDISEDWLAQHVIEQARLGRRLADILEDDSVVARCDDVARAHLLDRPEVVHALSTYSVEALRREIAAALTAIGSTG
jgi:urease gamma subunit